MLSATSLFSTEKNHTCQNIHPVYIHIYTLNIQRQDFQNKLLKQNNELTLEQLAFLEYAYSYFSSRNDFTINRIKKNLNYEKQRSIFRKDSQLHLTYIKNEHSNADWKLLADYLLAVWDHVPIESELS